MSTRRHHRAALKLACTGVALAVLSGCTSVNFDQSLADTNQTAGAFTQGRLLLAQTSQQRAEQERMAEELLQKPLGQEDAVRLALVNSPDVQALLAQNWADAASAAQGGRIANPVLGLERVRFAGELELNRMLTFGLLDLLTLPQRYSAAQRQIAASRLQLSSSVVDLVTQVRQAWVNAVAAQQTIGYARQVNDAAQASAELARRMQAAGNFTLLQRAREQAFYADAATQWAVAQQTQTASREALVRLLGLTDAQAEKLALPERLPDLPKAPRPAAQVGQQASAGRLDIQLAQAQYQALAAAQGFKRINSLTDIELGVRRDKVVDAAGNALPRSGYQVSVRLPVFDWGDNQRSAMHAQTLAAANRLQATVRAAGSNLRESYAAYRTAFDVSRHYRDEVVPLRKTISDENQLRYNGMLIGVFELLADSRDQVSTVMAAIAAQQQFWLADAALQASMIGRPTASGIRSMATGSTGGGAAGH